MNDADRLLQYALAVLRMREWQRGAGAGEFLSHRNERERCELVVDMLTREIITPADPLAPAGQEGGEPCPQL